MTPIKYPQLPFLTREMLAFGRDAKLELETVIYSSSTATVLMVGMTREGVIKYDVTHAGTSAEEVTAFGVHDFPISLTVFTDSALVERGEVFASVYFKVNGERVYKLCSGYVTKQSGINFPQTHDESELSGRALITGINGAAVAAGAQWDEAPTTNRRWRLIGATATLTTDANAANRRVHLRIGIAAFVDYIECFSNVDQTASTARVYSFASYPALLTDNDDNDILVPIPPNLQLVGGWELQSGVTNMQAGDAWTDIRVFVEEFFED